MTHYRFLAFVGALLIGATAAPALADEARAVAVALRPSAPAFGTSPATAPQITHSSQELVLSAPPRDSAAEGERRFGPIAEHLSRVLGRPVVYKHPGTWGGYQADMQRGGYDIVFDGPHFNGWRVEKLGHNVLVKLPGEFVYGAVVRKDNDGVRDMRALIGQKICAHAPPNLGTLIMYDQFTNPARQPVVITTDGYDKIYDALVAGKCTAAMLPVKHLKKRDPEGVNTRVVFQNAPLPQQAFSVGPRVAPPEQARVSEALLALNTDPAFAAFREAYSLGRALQPAGNAEYQKLGFYLRDMHGFY